LPCKICFLRDAAAGYDSVGENIHQAKDKKINDKTNNFQLDLMPLKIGNALRDSAAANPKEVMKLNSATAPSTA